jgi:phage shock protein PspC (stress-responsive transcriptional regulator)
MPTRIRANGMAIAMIINQGVSAGIATVFPRWCAATNDNGTVFFVLAGFTVVYFITAAFFLPETKGRTLEEVEQYFKTGKMPEKNQ